LLHPTNQSPYFEKKEPQYPNDSRLYIAARSGVLDEVKRVLEVENVDINSLDFNTGRAAIHLLLEMKGTEQILEYLIEKGADINLKDRKGQSPLHLSIVVRKDTITNLLMEKGADLFTLDNTGKTPYSMAELTPQYQSELKEYYRRLEKSRAQERKTEEIKNNEVVTEAVLINLKGGSHHTVAVNNQDDSTRVVALVAKKLGLLDVTTHFELVEEVMGKERRLESNELVLTAKGKWPNQNATFCKLHMRLKRGSPEHVQLKFRERIYGM